VRLFSPRVASVSSTLASSAWTAAYRQSPPSVALTRGRCRRHPRCGLQHVCVLRLCAAPSCPISPRACTTTRSTAALNRDLPLSLLTLAHVTSTQYAAIKGGHLCISSTTVPCPPLVSRRRCIASVIPLLCQCQASSPHLSPHAQVLELHKAPKQLPLRFKSHLH
jgi:hypothetical protein